MGEVDCLRCVEEAQVENLVHFLQECSAYDYDREVYAMHGKSIQEILLFVEGNDARISKMYLFAIWRKRKARIREIAV